MNGSFVLSWLVRPVQCKGPKASVKHQDDLNHRSRMRRSRKICQRRCVFLEGGGGGLEDPNKYHY